jgi:hypothetical protein
MNPDPGWVWMLFDKPGGGFDQLGISFNGLPGSIAMADFDHDGKTDFAFTFSGPSHGVYVVTDGGLGAKGPFATAGSPAWVAAGDVNGDGKPDLVTADTVSNSLSVLIGNGDGTFQPAKDVPAPSGSNPNAVALADFDGDGKPDALVALFKPAGVYPGLFPGNGDGSFGPEQDVLVGGSALYAPVVADFNGDVRPDFATLTIDPGPSVNMKVRLNTTIAPPEATTGTATGVTTSTATLAGTLNGHGYGVAYRFEYGTTTGYGSSTPAASASGAAQNVSAALAGLAPATVYHYRLVASSSWGSATGADATFTTATPPPPPPPPPPPVRCVVPKVVGKKLPAARKAIVRAHCRVGKVRKKFSRRVKKGRVLAQSPKAGKRLAKNAKVNLVVSRGRRAHR